MTGFPEDVRALFHAAAATSGDERERLLREADPDVRQEVRSLLESHDDTSPFLDRSVWALLETPGSDVVSGRMIGPYRVVRQLGAGGMGTVLLAVRDESEFSQRVAIKLVRGGASLVQRFRQERQILAALEHPNIARLLDGGTTRDGLPYLVMEYVDGTPIDVYARDLPLRQKLELFVQLCDAVQHAHRALVIHRDIKPANVLVTAEGVPKLLDFGIAKLVAEETRADETATCIMTPAYASPEQLRGEAVTTASDVFSLGVLLFQLLTGRPPFDGQRRPDSEAPAPGTVGPKSLRGDLDNIVLKALEIEPGRRYGVVEKLADDLRRYLGGHPVSARRATFAYRSAKFIRRNVPAVIAGLAVVIITAIAFAVTLQQKRVAERRFEQVRSLARSVVFELHDAIAPLPGSTPARALLVRRASVYLDGLAAEAETHNALRRELAEAYLRVGDVQGLPYQPNLGDTGGALTSYEKARALATSVTDDDPHDLAARALLATVNDRAGLVQQRASRWADAIRSHEKARSLRESLPRDAKRDVSLARTWTAIGDARYIGGDAVPPELRGSPEMAYRQALVILERLPTASRRSNEVLVELGRAHQRLGGYYSGPSRNPALAIRHHDAALEALAERAALNPGDAVARRNWADQFVMKATALNAAGDGAGALEASEQGLRLLLPLAAADARNVEAQHDLAFAYGERGVALRTMGRLSEAEESLREAVVIRRRLTTADPSNQESRRDLVRSEQLLAEVQTSATR